MYYSYLLCFCGASGDIGLCYDFLLQSCNRIFCLKSNITNRIDQQSFIHVFSLIFSYFLTFPFFDYTIIIFIIVYTIIISSQWSASRISNKILVLSQKFLYDVLPRVFCPCQKCQIITKLDFFTLPQKVQKLVLLNNSKGFQELHSLLF